MKIEPSGVSPDVVRILIDANELRCDGGKLLPYPTWIGTINVKTGEINVWTPAGYVPRGYRSAALRMLESVRSNCYRGG